MKDLKLLKHYFFVPDFNLFCCKLDKFTFKVLYRVILFYIKEKLIL